MYETIEISEEEASFRRNVDLLFGRMRSLERENEKLLADSVALDKIIKRIDGDDQCDIRTAHDAFELIHDIRKIIEKRGD